MEQRRIGDSGLVCSALGFGTWEMSTTMYGHIDVQDATRAVQSAIDHGITLFDTAEVYGPFHSEEILAKALGPRRQETVLVTKVGFTFDDQNKISGRDSDPAYITGRAEGCLRRMNTDYVDLLLIHWPDHKTPIGDAIGALEKLKQDGKIRRVWRLQLHRAHDGGVRGGRASGRQPGGLPPLRPPYGGCRAALLPSA